MVFGSAMTSEYNRIDNLLLLGKRISTLINGTSLLRKMTGLKDLNLANNRIEVVTALNECKGLHSLVLDGNRINEISNLALPLLTQLSLDGNRIRKITGLRGLKKLEELNLANNLLTEAQMQDVGF